MRCAGFPVKGTFEGAGKHIEKKMKFHNFSPPPLYLRNMFKKLKKKISLVASMMSSIVTVN